MRRSSIPLLVAGFLALAVAAQAGMPAYKPGTEVQGSLRCVGSDTIRILLEAWTQAYARLHPEASFEIESLGSATAPPALLAGKCDIAAMSRRMAEKEIAQFEQKYGYKPLDIHVSLDAEAVVVHPDNPVEGLTLKQLDGIFSSTHACGSKDITRWNQVYLAPGTQPKITLYGRNSKSGSYEFFRQKALCGGEFKDSVQQMPDSEDIEEAIENDISGIGYSGLGYRTDTVKVLAIARSEDSGYYSYFVKKYQNNEDLEKRYGWVYRGEYPLTRVLRLYVNKKPGEDLPAHLDDFLRFILSQQGQKLAHETGYIPLTTKMTQNERKKLEADYSPSWWIF